MSTSSLLLPFPVTLFDCGHLHGDDTPLVVVAVFGDGRLNVIDDDGMVWPTYAACFVRETASIAPARLRQAMRRSRTLVLR